MNSREDSKYSYCLILLFWGLWHFLFQTASLPHWEYFHQCPRGHPCTLDTSSDDERGSSPTSNRSLSLERLLRPLVECCHTWQCSPQHFFYILDKLVVIIVEHHWVNHYLDILGEPLEHYVCHVFGCFGCPSNLWQVHHSGFGSNLDQFSCNQKCNFFS